MALRTKDAEKRTEALSIAFGCIVAGVTEPAIYGINLPRKKPMYGVMAGGAVGGVVAGLLGAKAYVMGYSTVLGAADLPEHDRCHEHCDRDSDRCCSGGYLCAGL